MNICVCIRGRLRTKPGVVSFGRRFPAREGKLRHGPLCEQDEGGSLEILKETWVTRGRGGFRRQNSVLGRSFSSSLAVVPLSSAYSLGAHRELNRSATRADADLGWSSR